MRQEYVKPEIVSQKVDLDILHAQQCTEGNPSPAEITQAFSCPGCYPYEEPVKSAY